jgi:hypothetical protein
MLKEVLNKATAKTVATKAAEHAGRNHTGEGKAIDPKFGAQLFKDKRIPVSKKLLSLFLGFVAIGISEVLDFPLEAILAPILGLFSIPLEIASEGIEYTIGVLAIGATLLPHLAPKPLVQQIRDESRFNTVTATSEPIGNVREIPAQR